ncbi:DnaJ domain-containing protein [Legionella brunensis]|uniref:Multifunctional virulence effector protein DrrA n=1 Tax=Legionella brunensis TaxID=29422 RepID=A0A0W0SP07_9GAMM|nr:DnaJ domain-containing protein [Legionella brunensis]KTC85143.1 multifunctional virulence effector protein DrrA [Legionella brunensis]
MASNNFDGLLELFNNAEILDIKDLKKNYQKAALKWHPDKNPGNPIAEENFKALNEMYNLLLPLVEKEGKISNEEVFAIAQKMVDSSPKANNVILNMIAGIKDVGQSLAEGIRSMWNALVGMQLHYQYARVDKGSRKHSFGAELTEEQQKNLDPSLRGLKGDALKTQILANFKASITKLDSQEKIDKVVEKFKEGPEYAILKTGQDRTTRFFNLSTTSAKGVEGIVEDVKKDLAYRQAAVVNPNS